MLRFCKYCINAKDLFINNIYFSIMETEKERLFEILNRFMSIIIQGVENLTYKDKHIGIGIFLINYIGKKEECFMKDIINYLKVIPSTATRRIDKLVRNGLVKRNLSKDDGRLKKLTLTSEGKELYMTFMQNRLMSFDLIKQEFNEDELNFFFNVLDRMIRRSEEFKSKFP